MRIIHTSMTSTFYLEFIASFECKSLQIFTPKCTSHGYMYHINSEKLADNVKTVNVVARILTGSQDGFVLKFQGVAVNQS